MFKRLKGQKSILFFSLFFLLATIILFFQNCGQIKLQTRKQSSGGSVIGEDARPTFLKPPTAESTRFRAAIVIDMSFSMRGDACSGTLDILDIGEIVERITNPCNLDTGVDNALKRISLAREWIVRTQQTLSERDDYDSNETFKVSIIPFAGPSAEEHLNSPNFHEPLIYNFRNVDAALRFLKKLETIQLCYGSGSCDVSADLAPWTWTNGQSNYFVGTSVPALGISKLPGVLTAEMNNLRTTGGVDLRSQSRFEVVYISDGVPKPRIDHIVEVANIVWTSKERTVGCVDRCSDELRRLLTENDYFTIGGNQFNGGGQEVCYPDDTNGGLGGFYECFSTLNGASLYPEDYTTSLIDALNSDDDPNNDVIETGRLQAQMSAQWGEARDNQMLNILMKLKDVKNIFVTNPMVQFRQNFIRVDAEDVSMKTYQNQLKPEINWIEKSKSVFINNYRYAVLNSDSVPFDLFPIITTIDSYKLKQIVAINLNARINPSRTISEDSDSDGMIDSVELSSNGAYNPQKARTDGFCLDTVKFMMNGCLIGSCDPEVDEDGDGLNSCDEQTLKTKANDFDTDDDGISDGVEILMGFSPFKNDQAEDDNRDGISNFANYEQGLPPWPTPGSVAPALRTNIDVDFFGYKEVINGAGEVVQVPGYTVSLKSMPLARTEPITVDIDLYKNASKTEDSKWNYSLTGGKHSALDNTVLIIAKIENFQNPRDFYWITKKVVIPFGNPILIDFDFENMDYRFVPDPHWSDQ